MKNIDFRVWDDDCEIMVYSTEFDDDIDWFYYPSINKNGHLEIKRDGEATVAMTCKDIMLGTGLLDKNGKQIYEGDIVKLEQYFEKNTKKTLEGEIVFKYGSFSISVKQGNSKKIFDFYNYLKGFYNVSNYHNLPIEIIGNKKTQRHSKRRKNK